jgi:hypothetical protein
MQFADGLDADAVTAANEAAEQISSGDLDVNVGP